VESFCEHGNESGDFTTQTKCLYWLSNCQFVKKASDVESRTNVIHITLQQAIINVAVNTVNSQYSTSVSHRSAVACTLITDITCRIRLSL